MSGYSQRDAQWANDHLGTSTYWTMGMAGCLVTAGADVLRAFGHDINPGDLNRLATSRGLIDSNGDVTRGDWLSVLFPDVLRFIETAVWNTEKAPLTYFDIRNDLNTEIILMIDDSPAAGMQTHFMRTVGWDGGNDVIVDDSWDAIRKGVSAYGARWIGGVSAAAIIYKAYKYIKVTPAPSPTPPPVVVTPPAPTPPPLPPQPVPTPPTVPPVVTPDPVPETPETTEVPKPPVLPEMTPLPIPTPPSESENTSLTAELFTIIGKLIAFIAKLFK